MTDQASKKPRPRDLNRQAASIVEEATADRKDSQGEDSGKNPHAVALGRLGGKKGGKARAQKLTPEERRLIASAAAKARWDKEGK
jgi:hypothetical protein